MKKSFVCIMLLLLLCLTACGQKNNDSAGALTEEEISFFNENFFTTETEYPGTWVRNNILYTEFTKPAQVDVAAMIYNEAGETVSEEEKEYLRTQVEELLDTSKFTTAYIDELLQTYLGISLKESEKNGLDSVIYYEKEDAYYLVRSDALAVFVQVEEGFKNEDGTITLQYIKTEEPVQNLTENQKKELPRYQVVLKETENGYQFLSNQEMK